MNGFLYSPPVFFLIFLLLAILLYTVLMRFTEEGQPHTSKHQPYTGGQDFPTPEVELSYQAFFRIGMLFAILHVTTLVLSLLPLEWDQQRASLLYLLGILVSAIILVQPEHGEE